MRAGLLVIGIAVLACGAAGLLLAAASARDLATGGAALLSAAATLLLAAATAVFAWHAARRTRDMAAEIERLARSVDAALGDLAQRADRERAEIAELQDLLFRDSGEGAAPPEMPASESEPPTPLRAAPAPAAAPRARAATPAGGAGTQPRVSLRQQPAAIPLPTPHLGPAQPPPRGNRPAEASTAQGPEAGVDAALAGIVKAGKAELSVQPIISVARGAVRGHDVHVHVAVGEHQLHLRRPQRNLPGQPQAALERFLVMSAMDAARRRLAPASGAMPLHVAVSDALLGDERELAMIFDFLRSNPALARSLILSLPATIAAADHRSALRRLAAAGIRLAVEGWNASHGEFEILQRSGLRYLKLSADRLLDRAMPDDAPPAAKLLDLATESGVEIVATGVRTDEEAVALLNLGIDLMRGPRFSGPRQLIGEGGRKPAQARASEG